MAVNKSKSGSFIFVARTAFSKLRGSKRRIQGIRKLIISPNGILITFILGIFINVVSNRVQDIVERQRYLEILQYELTQIGLSTYFEIKEFNDSGLILAHKDYPTVVYEAGLNNGYLLTVNQEQLVKITSFYNYLYGVSALSSRYDAEMDEYQIGVDSCLITTPLTQTDICGKETSDRDMAQKYYSTLMVNVSKGISEKAVDILNEFRPVQRRLGSPLLRLLMGTNTMEILK